MARKLLMGQKEMLKGKLTAQVEAKLITLKAAGARLGISYRQGKRILAAYRNGGDAALIHGNTGKVSPQKTAETIRLKALEAYRGRYSGFGPTFAAEKLAETGDSRVRRNIAEMVACGRFAAEAQEYKRARKQT